MNWPSEPTGNSSLAKFLRRVVSAGRANELQSGVGYRVRRSTQGTTLEIDGGNGGNGGAQCFKLKEMYADYWIGHTWDGVNEGTADVAVAKDPAARQPATQTIAGTSYVYTYSAGPDDFNDSRNSYNGSSTESQHVVPFYIEDDLIFAIPVANTDVNRDDTDDAGADASPVLWVERSPRCWSRYA